ncbi:MAG: M90 family metallopeptidase [Rubrivivax sp.]
MLGRLFTRWQTRRDDAAVARRPIRDDLWKRTLVRYPFLQRRDAGEQALLRRMTSLFLDRKEFDAAAGVRLTDDVVVAVAAQACLPVLTLGLAAYDGFVGIVLHPDAVLARRCIVDEDGVVHEYDEELAGEAMHGGPVMLSWRDVRGAGRSAAEGYNVVIHEFAHVLDMAQGFSAGSAIVQQHHAAFAARVDAEEETLLDPYGAEAPEEFFAVASEAFFVNAAAFKAQHPVMHGVLSGFYRQDPAAAQPAPRKA